MLKHVLPLLMLAACAAASTSTTAPRKMGISLATDPNNCGTAGTQCGTWKHAGGDLVSLNVTNCIESTCTGGIVCIAGNGCCQTPPGLNIAIPVRPGNAICNGVCVNVLSDPGNCGACGVTCSHSVCSQGQCQ